MSTVYRPKKHTGTQFKELSKLTLRWDEARLRRLVSDANGEMQPKPLGKFDPKAQYALTDGKNWLWVNFRTNGTVRSATRHGSNYVETLLDFCGEMVPEES